MYKAALLIPFLIFGINCFSQVDIHKKAEAAGKFIAAIVSADEFKKSQCGHFISIDKKFTDVEYNKRQVIKSFAREDQNELLEAFNSQFISNQRVTFRNLYAQIPNNKCQQFINQTFWFTFDDAVTAWDKVR